MMGNPKILKIMSQFIPEKYRMNSELKQALSEFSDWIRQFEFDPVYGYLIDPQYKPISFNYDSLAQMLCELSELNKSGQIIERVKSMDKIKINEQQGPPHKDMVILHDGCSYLIHSFVKTLKDKGVEQTDIIIPENLAQALVESASYLKVKTGMATGIGYNWRLNKQLGSLDDMTIEDIQIKYLYSAENQENQKLFFRVSVVCCYCLIRIIQNCYEMNCIIVQQPNLVEEIVARMKNVKHFMTKIFQANLEIQKKMDPHFFFHVLRIFVAGYQHVLFQGINQKVSSSGGAGGYDPSFQTFQRAFSINFDGELGSIQEKLRNGMPEPHRKLIDFMAENSLIRQYCEITEQLQSLYNSTIQAYVKYLELHGTFIKNFIIHFMPINAKRSSFGATGATMIKIVDRFRFVRDQEFGKEKAAQNKQNSTE